MKAQISRLIRTRLTRGGLSLTVLVACILATFSSNQAPARGDQRTITFAERVAYQRIIEDVYWRHRIWPKENTNPKPSLDAVMSQAQLEKKVTDYLRKSQALEESLRLCSCRLRWNAWRSTPSNPRCCVSSLKP